jgi:hypothetical protein
MDGIQLGGDPLTGEDFCSQLALLTRPPEAAAPAPPEPSFRATLRAWLNSPPALTWRQLRRAR